MPAPTGRSSPSINIPRSDTSSTTCRFVSPDGCVMTTESMLIGARSCLRESRCIGRLRASGGSERNRPGIAERVNVIARRDQGADRTTRRTLPTEGAQACCPIRAVHDLTLSGESKARPRELKTSCRAASSVERSRRRFRPASPNRLNRPTTRGQLEATGGRAAAEPARKPIGQRTAAWADVRDADLELLQSFGSFFAVNLAGELGGHRSAA